MAHGDCIHQVTNPTDRLTALRERLRAFVEERDWQQFHDPKNLAMAIASEAGELLAELRWTRSENADSVMHDEKKRRRIEAEVADIAIALLYFCDRTGIDLLGAVERKIEDNARKYPADASRGVAERPVPSG
jgi:NTP pyrophosphatase (non-canonical NTP hydrolase)